MTKINIKITINKGSESMGMGSIIYRSIIRIVNGMGRKWRNIGIFFIENFLSVLWNFSEMNNKLLNF